MQTENTKSVPAEKLDHRMSLAERIWLYAQDDSGKHFNFLLDHLLDTEKFALAIEVLKLRALKQIHGDLDAIAVSPDSVHRMLNGAVESKIPMPPLTIGPISEMGGVSLSRRVQ